MSASEVGIKERKTFLEGEKIFYGQVVVRSGRIGSNQAGIIIYGILVSNLIRDAFLDKGEFERGIL